MADQAPPGNGNGKDLILTRLSQKEYKAVMAYTDPKAPEFNKWSAALRCAGYATGYVRKNGYQVKARERVAAAIAHMTTRTVSAAGLDRAEFITKALKAHEAWLDPDGVPFEAKIVNSDGDVEVIGQTRPSTAEVKSLELAGKAAKLLDSDGPQVQVNTFLIALPTKAPSADAWLEQHVAGDFGEGGRAIEAGQEGDEPDRLPPPKD